MRRLASHIVVFTASCALAACAGAGSPGSALTPQGAQLGDPGSAAQLADAAYRQKIAGLARSRIKHVFVLVQENHTFDQIYGLFPGVNGQYVENLGTYLAQETDCEYDPQTFGCQRPFLISANQNSPNYVQDAPDISGGNNGRYDQEVSIDRGKMDDFLVDDEAGQPPLGPTRTRSRSSSTTRTSRSRACTATTMRSPISGITRRTSRSSITISRRTRAIRRPATFSCSRSNRTNGGRRW